MVNKNKRLKILTYILLPIIVGLLLWMCFSGGNFELVKSVFTDNLTNEKVHERLLNLGIRGYATVVILSMLQVVFTFLPAEPVQVIAGVAFGFPVGLLCCTIGVFLGNSVIFLLYKVLGNSMREYFDRNFALFE